MHWDIAYILNKKRFQNVELGPAPRGAKGKSVAPSIDMLGPPINKLTLFKKAAILLNFKLWPPPYKCLAPLSRLLCRQLCVECPVKSVFYFIILNTVCLLYFKKRHISRSQTETLSPFTATIITLQFASFCVKIVYYCIQSRVH